MDYKEITNDFELSLVDNEYNIFKSSFNNSYRGFQKRFDDKKGKKYFITIWHYKYDREDIHQKDSYTANCQFRFDKNGKDSTCNVEFWGDVLPNEYREIVTLKDIEDFFETFWKKMKPDYYEKYLD